MVRLQSEAQAMQQLKNSAKKAIDLLLRLILLYGKVELISLVEHFAHSVYLQERGLTAHSKATTQIGYLVIHRDVAFLMQHSEGCEEKIL